LRHLCQRRYPIPMKPWSGRTPLRVYLLASAAIIAIAALIEHALGRLWICKCGHIRLWASVNTSELSQQIADAYTFSHIIHGLAFYGLWHLLGRGRWPLGFCLLLAICVEC